MNKNLKFEQRQDGEGKNGEGIPRRKRYQNKSHDGSCVHGASMQEMSVTWVKQGGGIEE